MRDGQDIQAAADRRLLARARDRTDEAAARRAAADLLGKYRIRVYSWCLRHMEDHDQALDMAQDVLLKAYSNLDSYSGRSPFVGWLWAVARNHCLSELRRPRLLYEEGYDGLQSREPRPDQELERKLGEERVVNLIERCLDPVEQQAIHLRCFEKMPVDAITQALGIQERTGARAVLQRARRKLRAALAAEGMDPDGERA